jgi:hypothetical protein
MLHELLAATLAEAFLEWRAVAAEKAHWRQVRVAVQLCPAVLCTQLNDCIFALLVLLLHARPSPDTAHS